MPDARAGPVGAASGRPSTASIASAGTPPGRNSVGASPTSSTIVDSTPMRHAPPSSTHATSVPPSSASTSAAVVGLTRPKRLADGAATGKAHRSSRARATGWSGTRSPTVSRPPVVAGDSCGARRNTNVSGPGQNASARRRASSPTSSAQRSSSDASARWAINGWPVGRPLTAKIRATASALVASAPRP